MNGRVDSGRRALVTIKLKRTATAPVREIEAWIDTGFNGDLVLPHSIIEELGLSQSATVDSQLGDGETAVLDTYSCLVDWFDRETQIQAISSKIRIPLLGVGLLINHRLTVDFPAKSLSIE
jgi:clan AA aspartic protease